MRLGRIVAHYPAPSSGTPSPRPTRQAFEVLFSRLAPCHFCAGQHWRSPCPSRPIPRARRCGLRYGGSSPCVSFPYSPRPFNQKQILPHPQDSAHRQSIIHNPQSAIRNPQSPPPPSLPCSPTTRPPLRWFSPPSMTPSAWPRPALNRVCPPARVPPPTRRSSR